eukprot:CAMPEP_0115217766 /NCGR_PEP_ID=MMETSP0270-20121206/26036_1 /TAXON_ID=71861 /ORGANISM="Scrippsiella trochoidea, Strain CCMP3099" /LENGTH=126 /DNA_ID=CAMNT_0002631671 /DNA_START=565 /DNA_END=945 /DNA_ORIENTATION=+
MSVLQHVELPSRLAAAGDALGFVSAKLAADLTGPPASDHQHSTIPRCSSHVLWLGEVDAMTAAASTMPDCQTSMMPGQQVQPRQGSGEEPTWNLRDQSKDHSALLPSASPVLRCHDYVSQCNAGWK